MQSLSNASFLILSIFQKANLLTKRFLYNKLFLERNLFGSGNAAPVYREERQNDDDKNAAASPFGPWFAAVENMLPAI